MEQNFDHLLGGLSDSAYLDKAHYSVYWSNINFHKHKEDTDYNDLVEGWAEKRGFLNEAGSFLREVGQGTFLHPTLLNKI